MTRPRFHPADHGEFYAETGELIGHEAVDVMAWLAEHPDYDGSISFERRDFEGGIDVTETFIGEDAMFLPSPTIQNEAA